MDAPSEADTTRYKAPALEKGLDVIELLASEKRPLTLAQISTLLGRSSSELFRMVQALENRGYIAPSRDIDGFVLTNKLFSLGMSQGPSHNLLKSALPIMQTLTDEIRQSCHLVIPSETQIVVVARVEAPGELGFSVRIGHQRKLVGSTSGVSLYGFQVPSLKVKIKPLIQATVSEAEWTSFEDHCRKSVNDDMVQSASGYVQGVIDISYPVFNETGVVAALTIPYIQALGSASFEDAKSALKSAAKTLSKELGWLATNL